MFDHSVSCRMVKNFDVQRILVVVFSVDISLLLRGHLAATYKGSGRQSASSLLRSTSAARTRAMFRWTCSGTRLFASFFAFFAASAAARCAGDISSTGIVVRPVRTNTARSTAWFLVSDGSRVMSRSAYLSMPVIFLVFLRAVLQVSFCVRFQTHCLARPSPFQTYQCRRLIASRRS